MVSNMKHNKITALVPMKGHSERVPNKNIRNFCGKPLYHRIVEVLLASKHINQVYIERKSRRSISFCTI